MYRYACEIGGKVQKIGKKTNPTYIASDIWDTAGQESFNELHPTYYYGAHVCILVFDANRKITYQNLQNWYKELKENCPHIPCMVIANKIDMDEKATARRYKFIEEIGCPFNFVSAANGTNVVAVFK
jgi:Rab-like protein 2